MRDYPPPWPTDHELDETDEADNVAEIRQLIEALRTELDNEASRAQLHPVELAIAQDLVAESRRLRCPKCHRLLQKLIDKARSRPES